MKRVYEFPVELFSWCSGLFFYVFFFNNN